MPVQYTCSCGRDFWHWRYYVKHRVTCRGIRDPSVRHALAQMLAKIPSSEEGEARRAVAESMP